MKRNSPLHVALVLLVFAVVGVVERVWRPPVSEGAAAILKAFDKEKSGVWVEAEGTVFKLLPDDRAGDQHQRFLIRLDARHSLLVAHNIDVASRAPVREGDTVRFRGQYEWGEEGGTLHWTHRDPSGRRPGGWIELNGRRYE